jgi:6-pyruvoyltetrahydropterin/6-carboxytetrahydropterin synthase
VFPVEDCCVLPIANTTAELMAHWIGCRLIDELGLKNAEGIRELRVGIEENFGQWATVRLPTN